MYVVSILPRDPWYEPARRRPGMYVGSVGTEGVLHLVYEVLANAIDLFLQGRCTAIEVTVRPDGTVQVVDDGPGWAVVGDPSSMVQALTTLHYGPTQDGHPVHVHLASFGRGLAVVHALSDLIVVTTSWEGRRWRLTGAAGELRGPPEDLGTSTTLGTTVEFHPDPAIFPGVVFDTAPLVRRLSEVAALCPGLTLRFVDQRVLTFEGDPGFRGLLSRAPTPQPPAEWRTCIRGARRPDPPVHAHAEVPGITVDVRLQWSLARDVGIWSFVNLQPTEKGVHVDGLRRGVGALARVLGDLGPAHKRLQRHLVAVVSVMHFKPTFAGPTRECLNNPEVEQLVGDAVEASVLAFVEAQPEEARAILAWLEQEDRGFGNA